MKNKVVFMFMILFISMPTFESCGPVVISSRLNAPPPPWFYPNRVETVRYVYFPEYMIYYDLSYRNYIYLNNGAWVTVNVLPARYSSVNLRRSKFVRIRDYRGDNISRYHKESNINRRRSSTRSSTRRKSN